MPNDSCNNDAAFLRISTACEAQDAQERLVRQLESVSAEVRSDATAADLEHMLGHGLTSYKDVFLASPGMQ